MKQRSLQYALWAGSAIVFVTLAIMFFTDSLNIYVLAAFVFGIILTVGSLSRYSECGSTEDERVKKIDVYARERSWYVTFLLVVALATLALLKLVDLGTYYSLMLVFLVMGYSWFAFKSYYGRKGDVQ